MKKQRQMALAQILCSFPALKIYLIGINYDDIWSQLLEKLFPNTDFFFNKMKIL